MSTRIKIQSTKSQPFILLPTFINDKGPFDFVLDTGAVMSIVTDELARMIGLEGTEVKEALGCAGKKLAVPLGKVASISIGETRVEDVLIGITKELPKCVGHGVLGYNYFKEFVLIIDYGNNLLTLTTPTDKGSYDRSPQASLPLRLARPDRPILLVDVRINAQKTYQFILDTAASLTVVSPELAQRMGIKDIQADSIIGAGGTIQGTVGILKSLSVGNSSCQNNLSVCIADVFQALSDTLDSKIDGILGYNFLSEYNVVIDYPNRVLRLEERSNR